VRAYQRRQPARCLSGCDLVVATAPDSLDELRSTLLKAIGLNAVVDKQLAGLARIKPVVIYGSWAHRYHGEVKAGSSACQPTRRTRDLG
jgi:hypothetical protein